MRAWIVLTLIVLPAVAAWGQTSAPASAPATRPAARDRQAERLLATFLTTAKFPPQMDILSRGWGFRLGGGRQGFLSTNRFAFTAGRFGEWVNKTASKHPSVQALCALGRATAAACNRAMAKANVGEKEATRLALLMGLVGDRQSVPLLIDRLARRDKEATALGVLFPSETHAGTTWALWQLSGRKFQKTSAQWKTWWQGVEKSFHPARDRAKLRVTAAQVAPLVAQLAAKDDELVRERLIILGPNAVPHLLKAFGQAPEARRDRLAWVIDELGAAEKIHADARRAYYIDRLVAEGRDTVSGQDTHRRALDQQSFADFCRTAIEVERRLATVGKSASTWVWIQGNSGAIRKRLSQAGADIPGAAVVLIKGINDPEKAARTTAVHLCVAIGSATGGKPERLSEALEKRWYAEQDGPLRYSMVLALSRFAAPVMTRVIKKGLRSDREEIVGDSAEMLGWYGLPRLRGPEKDEIDTRLVELVSHENDRIRRGSVRSLATRAPDLLVPHFDRLGTDSVGDIRYCLVGAIGRLKDPAHTERLVALAFDKKAKVRHRAFNVLSYPAYRKAIGRLAPMLKRMRDMGRAQRAISRARTPEAVAMLVQEILERNTVGGSIFNALRTASKMHRQFKTPQEVLVWWWGFPLNEPVPHAELDAKRIEALWIKLTGPVGLEAYQVLVAMAAGGDRTADLIAARVKPVTVDQKRIRALVVDLDSDKYAVRSKAFTALSRIGRPVGPALRDALKAKPSAEVRARAEQLIAAIAPPYPTTPKARRTARAVRILELIATPRARKVLGALAKGDALADVTIRAKAALGRIEKKKAK